MADTRVTAPSTGVHAARTARSTQHLILTAIRKVLLFGGLLLFGLLFVLPFYWNLLASLKFPSEARRIPPTWWPEIWTLTNYIAVLDPVFLRYFLNSFIYAGALTIIISFTSSLAGFVIVKFPSKVGNFIFWMIIAQLMVPFATYVIPLFGMMLFIQRTFGIPLLNTYQGMILPGMVSAFGIFLMRQAMLSVPGELLDAARIDGASTWRIYWNVALPLVTASLAALATFVFLGAYNDLLWPLIVAQEQEMFPISVGLITFVGEFYTEYGRFNAAAAISTVPIIVVYFLMQRHIVQGIALQGIKG